MKFKKLIQVVLSMFLTQFAVLEFSRADEYVLPLMDNVQGLSTYLKTHVGALDLNKMTDGKRLIYFGESHKETISKVFLIEHMLQFKKLGFTHLGLEMFASDRQYLLNNFENKKATDQDILDYLTESWGHIPNYYLKLLHAARAQGIKLIAIDYRPDRSMIDVDQRDKVMVRNITTILNDSPLNRMFVLIGSAHVDAKGDYATEYQPQVLEQVSGISSKVFLIVQKYGVMTSYRPKPGAKVGSDIDDYQTNPNWMKLTHYYLLKEPLNLAPLACALSTEYAYVSSSREDTGFDGLLYLDKFDEQTQLHSEQNGITVESTQL